MTFANLPEARQRAAVQVFGATVVVKAISKMSEAMAEVKEYCEQQVHPLFNDNRSANLIAVSQRAIDELAAAREDMSRAQASIALVSATLAQYSPENEGEL